MRSSVLARAAYVAAAFLVGGAFFSLTSAQAAPAGMSPWIKVTSLEACGFTLSPRRERLWRVYCSTLDRYDRNQLQCEYLCTAPDLTASIGGGGGGGINGGPPCIGPDCAPGGGPPPPCIGPNCPPGGGPPTAKGPPCGTPPCGNFYGNDRADNNTRDSKNRWDGSDNIHPGGGKPEDAGKPVTVGLSVQPQGDPEAKGPPEEKPSGPPEDKTAGPPEDKTAGPPEDKTTGPPDDKGKGGKP